jgi:hypothetical protein
MRENSRVFYIWATLISTALVYSAFYVTVSIAFDYTAKDRMALVFDVAAVSVYILDIYFKAHTAIECPTGEVVTNVDDILTIYSSQGLVLDVVAAIPFDYAGLYMGAPVWICSWIRLTRMLKFYRVYFLLNRMTEISTVSMAKLRLVILFVAYIYLNHLAACGMFYIGKLQFENWRYARFD